MNSMRVFFSIVVYLSATSNLCAQSASEFLEGVIANIKALSNYDYRVEWSYTAFDRSTKERIYDKRKSFRCINDYKTQTAFYAYREKIESLAINRTLPIIRSANYFNGLECKFPIAVDSKLNIDTFLQLPEVHLPEFTCLGYSPSPLPGQRTRTEFYDSIMRDVAEATVQELNGNLVRIIRESGEQNEFRKIYDVSTTQFVVTRYQVLNRSKQTGDYETWFDNRVEHEKIKNLVLPTSVLFEHIDSLGKDRALTSVGTVEFSWLSVNEASPPIIDDASLSRMSKQVDEYIEKIATGPT